jgi:hypothetical protein
MAKKEDDFSLRWFGIPDKIIVAGWKALEQMPRGFPHKEGAVYCLCNQCYLKREANHMPPIR